MVRLPAIPFGRIPTNWYGSLIIEHEPETRWFVERGPSVHFQLWMEEVNEANPGDLLPMQWAPSYVGVTRAAIRKRALMGKLTVFSFVVTRPEKRLLRGVEYRETRNTFDYLIRSECDAWRLERLERLDEEAEAIRADRRKLTVVPKAHRNPRDAE